jgi:ATP-dependent helicase/nuclease subunit B
MGDDHQKNGSSGVNRENPAPGVPGQTLQPLFTDTAEVRKALEAGGVVLTPNRRLSRCVLQALGQEQVAAGASAWLTPAVMPREQWLQERWQRGVDRGKLAPGVLLTPLQERRLWQRIILDDPADFSLLSPGRAAAQAMQARSTLMQWRVDYHHRDLRQGFSFAEDSRRFHNWLLQFDAALAAGGLLTRDDLQVALLPHPELLADRPLLLLEGEAPTPLLEALLQSTPRWERQEIKAGSLDHGPLLSFADERAELAAIARWCRARWLENPAGRYAVVLQDMGAMRERLEWYLRREFDCLTRRYESLPVNFATGLTLDRVPLVRDALRLLALGDRHIKLDDLLGALHSRFVRRLPLDPAKSAGALARLREVAQPELPAAIVRQLLSGVLPGDTPPWEALVAAQAQEGWHRRPRPASQWLPVFQSQLDGWGWLQGRPLDSLEHQQLEHWLGALEGLTGFDDLLGAISYAEVLSLLREQLAESLFQPRTADAAIQVLGPLETTGLRFDALWLAGMNAEQWPPRPRPLPFLPRQLQRASRMPHCDAQWEREQAERRLAAWKRSAGELRGSYLNLIDDVAALPTSLLRDLPAQPGDLAALDPRWETQAAGLVLEPVALSAQPLGTGEAAAAGVGSAALEQQSQCPFQAFAAQRLGCAPPGPPWNGLTPAERGMMLHRALYHLFGLVADSKSLRGLERPARRALLDEAIGTARSAVSPERRTLLGAAPLALEAARLGNLLSEWLDLEASRKVPFRVAEREAEREISLGGLTLRLRLDRIDLLEDGHRLVIDYKSGAAESPARWFDDPPTRPQLPLYALLDPPAEGIAFATVRTGEAGFHGVGERAYCAGISDDLARSSRAPELADMAAARAFWHGSLQRLASDFVAGENAIEPRGDACRRCGRQALCRIGELAR